MDEIYDTVGLIYGKEEMGIYDVWTASFIDCVFLNATFGFTCRGTLVGSGTPFMENW